MILFVAAQGKEVILLRKQGLTPRSPVGRGVSPDTLPDLNKRRHGR